MGGPEMAPPTPPTFGAPRHSRVAPLPPTVRRSPSSSLPDHLGLAREAPHRRGENQDRLDEESDSGHDKTGLRAVKGAHERAERGADGARAVGRDVDGRRATE